MPERTSIEISQAVFDTLLYSDIFDFPLTAHEIHRYLSGREATFESVSQVLESDPRFVNVGKYYTLTHREKIVQLRKEREFRSQNLLPRALKYGRVIGLLPFVRMVALTGSLAVGNVSGNDDFDYMLVTQPGRLWTARAFVLLFNRLARLPGHTICPNVIVTESSLKWKQHDLYSARDLCQMIPISGFSTYYKVMNENKWSREFLPNAYEQIVGMPVTEEKSRFRFLQNMFELLFRGSLGDSFERWEMRRKMERFSRQDGFGEETVFSAEICQGNFDQHRQQTLQQLWKRENTIKADSSLHKEKLI